MRSWCLVAVVFVGCAHVTPQPESLEQKAVRLFKESNTTRDAKAKERSDYELAATFRQLNLPFTAFVYFTPLVQAGPAHSFHLQTMEALAELQLTLRDDFLIPSTFNNYSAKFSDSWRALSPETRASISYQLARIANRKGKLTEARDLLIAVPPETPHFPKAQLLLATVLSDARFPHADDAERARNLATAIAIMEKNHSTLEVARIHYDADHLEEALRWYQQEPSYSEAWNHELFESLPTALPTLACLFVKSHSSLPEFEKLYLPLVQEIAARTVEEPKKNPFAFVELVTDENNKDLSPTLLTWLRSHPRVSDTVKMFAQLNAEQSDIATRPAWKAEQLSSEILYYLRLNHDTFELVTATTIRRTLQRAAAAITDFDQQVKRIQSGELTCR